VVLKPIHRAPRKLSEEEVKALKTEMANLDCFKPDPIKVCALYYPTWHCLTGAESVGITQFLIYLSVHRLVADGTYKGKRHLC